jgi:hypothetical protein
MLIAAIGEGDLYKIIYVADITNTAILKFQTVMSNG